MRKEPKAPSHQNLAGGLAEDSNSSSLQYEEASATTNVIRHRIYQPVEDSNRTNTNLSPEASGSDLTNPSRPVRHKGLHAAGFFTRSRRKKKDTGDEAPLLPDKKSQAQPEPETEYLGPPFVSSRGIYF